MIELKELTLGYGQRTLLETVNRGSGAPPSAKH